MGGFGFLNYPPYICIILFTTKLKKMNALENFSDFELRLELERRGYATRNLWTIHDVLSFNNSSEEDGAFNLKLSNEEALNILSNVLMSDSVFEFINDEIYNEVSEYLD
jgi:hypothetical protein